MGRGVKHSANFPLLNDEAWLRQKYEVEELTMGEIARLAGGCSVVTVLNAMNRFGIKRRDPKKAGRGKTGRKAEIPFLNDREWLAGKRKEGLNAMQIAKEIGCSFSIVCRYLRRYKMNGATEYADASQSPYYKQAWRLGDEAWLIEQYLVQGRKANVLADEIGVTRGKMYEALRRFELVKHPWRKKCEQARGENGAVRPGLVRSRGYLMEHRPDHPSANARGYVYQHRLVAEAAMGRPLATDEEVHHINCKRSDNRIDNLLVMPNAKAHHFLHHNQPPWVPRCGCCNKPWPESVPARPSWVPLIYDPELTYRDAPPVQPLDTDPASA